MWQSSTQLQKNSFGLNFFSQKPQLHELQICHKYGLALRSTKSMEHIKECSENSNFVELVKITHHCRPLHKDTV
jgi:hypothetical protein